MSVGDKKMNVLMFLTPKSQVAYIESDSTLRQVLEKMEFHGYSALPIIDKNGCYVGTIKDGDLLRIIKNKFNLSYREAETTYVESITRLRDNLAVKANASIDDILNTVVDQNFVPIVDDQNIFIGIVTRKKVLQYFFKNSAQDGKK